MGISQEPARPLLTVDCVLFSEAGVVLIRRKYPPFQGHYALPGGFVELGESVEDACRRETLEETGIRVQALTMIGVYSRPGRDPRRPTVTVAFLGMADLSTMAAGDDAEGVALVNDWRQVSLAFDHSEIITDAVRLRETCTPRIEFDEALWRDVRKHCVTVHLEVSEYVERLVREDLRK